MARTQLALATCNLYNLNLPGLPIYRDQDGWDNAAYERKVDWVAAALNRMPSDVWGFQELWHAEALDAVLERAGLDGDYVALVPPGHAGGRIVCAGAVRRDLLVDEPEWITDFPEALRLESAGEDDQTEEIAVAINAFSRPVLHLSIRPRARGKTIHVYVVHLKSKAPTQIWREGWYREETVLYKPHSEAIGAALSTVRRTAEAAALRVMLTGKMKSTDDPVVVLGDLNDGSRSNTLNILTGQPNYLFGESRGGSDTDLYTTAALQQYRSLRDVYYTHIYQNTRESLDHILVSQEFYDHSRKRLWLFKGMDVANDHLNTDDHKADGSVDHGIVRARFEYRPAR